MDTKFTKTSLTAFIVENSEVEVTKAQVNAVLVALNLAVVTALNPSGVAEITIPGLLKIKAAVKAAVKGGQKKENPLTGGTYVTKDKPASIRLRALPVKALKDAVPLPKAKKAAAKTASKAAAKKTGRK